MKNIILLALAVVSYASNAREQGSIPYKNINQVLVIIDEYAQSPYTGLISSIKPEVKGIKVTDISLSIIHRNELVQAIPVLPDGSVNFPLLPKQVGEEAILVINQPKGSVSLEFTAGIKPLKKHQVQYKSLFGVLYDLETIASELVGIPSWLIPDIEKIEFTFSNKSTIKISNSNTNQELQSNPEHQIVIEIDEALYASDPQVHFSSLPKNVTFIK